MTIRNAAAFASALLWAALLLCVPHAAGQAQPLNPFIAGGPGAAFGPGGQQNAAGQNLAGQGGGANADFQSLMDLIVSTVAAESWAENGGGEAEIRPFVGGVYVDAEGTLRRLEAKRQQPGSAARGLAGDLRRLRAESQENPDAPPKTTDARHASSLRCVSLVRLERAIAQAIANKQPLEEAMLTLAGLRRVEYVFVYPESGDIVLAGAAGDWEVNEERRLVATDTGTPVVRLDDLITLLRRDPSSPYGCSIDPRPEGLAKAQEYLASHAIPSSRRGRQKWMTEVRACVGSQDLTYQGIPGDSRVACVLGEADYHMKLVGMGLVDGAPGMESYLESIKVRPGSPAPSVGAVRWWFAMNYTAIERSAEGDAYRLAGQGVKVLSENEALAAQGVRVPTGKADEHALEYATSFTRNFAALCQKYPLYAELRNVFDLTLVVSLLKSEGLVQKAGWSPTLLVDSQRLPLPSYQAPKSVETVTNIRQVGRRQVVAAVSGGVWARPTEVVRQKQQVSDDYRLTSARAEEAPEDQTRWWWDVGR